MKRLTWQETIAAPVKKVWDTMLKPDTYRVWTREFNPYGSWYVGNIEEPGNIQFIGPHPEQPDEVGGLASKVVEVRKYEYVGLEHQGELHGGSVKEDAVWKGARENYIFTKKDENTTELTVELDVLPGEFEAYMADAWPRALKKLKELSEGNAITIGVLVNVPVKKAWEYWNNPEHITKWNFASDDWECPRASNDLKVGGKLVARMQAKDKSAGFDFAGTYTNVAQYSAVEYILDGEDKRNVRVYFDPVSATETYITETFDPEAENPQNLQRDGWQAILENFKTYAETSESK